MELFPVTPEEIEEIRKLNNTTQEKIDQSVGIIKEWMKKQPHLPQKLHYESAIENMLLHNNFSIERAKENLDNYFTLKYFNKSFYENLTSAFVLPSQNPIQLVPLPKLGPNKERIMMFSFLEGKSSVFQTGHFVQPPISVMELLFRYDYANGWRVIIDCKNHNLEYLVKTDLAQMGRLLKFLFEGCSSKIYGIHLLFVPGYFDVVTSVMKAVLPTKLIFNHKNLESLYELVPRTFLPEEYGGESQSLATTMQKMDCAFQSHRDFFNECINFVSNEDLRIGKSKYDVDMFGMDGTFKQLNVD